jgi:hypothetical protein
VLSRVLAVDVEEADGAAADGGDELLRRHQPAITLVHDEAASRHSVRTTIRLEASTDARVRPSEMVNRQRLLVIGEGERHGDE